VLNVGLEHTKAIIEVTVTNALLEPHLKKSPRASMTVPHALQDLLPERKDQANAMNVVQEPMKSTGSLVLLVLQEPRPPLELRV